MQAVQYDYILNTLTKAKRKAKNERVVIFLDNTKGFESGDIINLPGSSFQITAVGSKGIRLQKLGLTKHLYYRAITLAQVLVKIIKRDFNN